VEKGLLPYITKGKGGYWTIYNMMRGGKHHFPNKMSVHKERIILKNGKIRWKSKKDKRPCMLAGNDLYKANLFHGHKDYKAYNSKLIGYLLHLDNEVDIVGSGGAPTRNGANGCDLEAAANPEEAAHATVEHPQSILEHNNRNLFNYAHNGKVMALSISAEVFNCARPLLLDTIGIITGKGPGLPWFYEYRLRELYFQKSKGQRRRLRRKWRGKFYKENMADGDGLFLNYFWATRCRTERWTPQRISLEFGLRTPTLILDNDDEKKARSTKESVDEAWEELLDLVPASSSSQREFWKDLWRMNPGDWQHVKFRLMDHLVFSYKEVSEEFLQRLPKVDDVTGNATSPVAMRTFDVDGEANIYASVAVEDGSFNQQLRSLCPSGIDALAIEDSYLHAIAEATSDLELLNSPTGKAKEKKKPAEGEKETTETKTENERYDQNDDEEETPEVASTRRTSILLDVKGLLRSQVFVGAAGCKRAKGDCLRADPGNNGSIRATPLKQKEFGTNMRKYPLPMPNRAADLNSCVMRRIHLKLMGGKIPPDGRSMLVDNKPDETFWDRMYQATLMAFAGDPFETSKYELDTNPPSGACFPRPTDGDVNHYIKYLEGEFARGKNFGKFTYRQFGKQTPSVLVGGHDSRSLYVSFVRGLARNYRGKMKRLYTDSFVNGEVDRFLFMYKYAELMQEAATNGEINNFMFVSNQVMLTMSELYEGDPLGKRNSSNVLCGGGAVGGAESVKQKGLRRTKDQKKKYAYGRYTKEDAEKYLSLRNPFLADIISEETLAEIVEEVEGKMEEDHLEMMLWKRVGEKDVRNLINGRKFGIEDVEHMLVSWQCTSYTLENAGTTD
jgi:hypothetical protein